MTGAQRPRILHAPQPIIGDYGQMAIDLAYKAGLELDDWQQWLMLNACSVDPGRSYVNQFTGKTEYKWQYLRNGITVARQNGKGSLLEARELAGLFLFGEKTLIHSAHRFDTSQKHYVRMRELMERTTIFNKLLKPNGRSFIKSHGLEAITLRTGQTLEFRTRAKGGARGYSCDFLALDECMDLSGQLMGDIFPTLSAMPNAQAYLTGSAGDQKNSNCEVQAEMRENAQKGKGKRMFFAEWSIDWCGPSCPQDSAEFECEEHDNPHLPETWAKANPGQDIRIDTGFLQEEHDGAIPWDEFLRECLCVGDYPMKGEAWKIISKDAWQGAADERAEMVGDVCIGIAISPDRSWSCIAAAGQHIDNEEAVLIEITGDGEDRLDYWNGTHGLGTRVIEICDRHEVPVVVIDTVDPAGGLIKQLEDAGINVVTLNSREYANACGEYKSGVKPAKGEPRIIYHTGQACLDSAVANVGERKLAEQYAWATHSSSADITPLKAATLAAWGYKEHIYSEQAADPWVAYV
jgi:phage terminase large subunit-like protein